MELDIDIDIESLRNDLLDYFGMAAVYNQAAIANLIEVENASDDKLVLIATKTNFRLDPYIIRKVLRK